MYKFTVPFDAAAPSNDPREPSDAARVDLIRTGSSEAFEALFREYAGPLLSVANSYVDSRSAAEDLVQDLFVRLWETRHTLETPRGIRVYLFSAIRNRALNWLRDSRRELRFGDDASVGDAASLQAGTVPADQEVIGRELEQAHAAAVASLPTRCREVYLLVRTRSLRYAEVAAVLGIAPKTVEVHMSRALAILRARLAPWLTE